MAVKQLGMVLKKVQRTSTEGNVEVLYEDPNIEVGSINQVLLDLNEERMGRTSVLNVVQISSKATSDVAPF